jgi:hypothetical protein
MLPGAAATTRPQDGKGDDIDVDAAGVHFDQDLTPYALRA